jgi:DNA modification methylase
MEIKTMNIAELMPAPYHPRKKQSPADPVYKKLKRSILEFGYVDPIIWNRRTGNIVGGHQRGQVLLDLGITSENVSIVDLSEEKEKVLNIALNKISGEWDLPRLKDLIIEIETYDVDIELTGFDEAEIEKLLGRDVTEDDFDAEAEADKIKIPVTRRGDIYQLGRHRLRCGDSIIPADMEKLMNGRKAGMVFTDPPYNVNYGATMKDKMRKRVSKENAGRTILNDNFETKEDFYQFLYSAISAIRPHVAGDVYICMSSSELHTLQRAFSDCGGHFSTFIIWIKNHFTIGRANYQRQYEPILYGWFEGTSHYWSGVRNLGDIYGRHKIILDSDGVPLVRAEACGIESDIWEFPKPVKSKDHPTMKPIGLCARSIRNSSPPGALVADAFGGSGSTLMAAEQTGRECYVMELSEIFCDVIIKRWETFTGQKASLIDRESNN